MDFPPALFPLVFFPNPDEGANPTDYLTALWTNMRIPPAAQRIQLSTAIVGHTGPAAALPLLDAEPALAQAPRAARMKLEIQQAAVLRAIGPFLPLLNNESLIETKASCLNSSFAGLPAGTVVLIHTTSATTRYLALPRIQVDRDSATGASTFQLKPEPISAPAAVVQDDSSSFLDGILNLGGVFSFALPAPWGALVAGAFSLFRMLLGLGEDKPDPFAQVVTALENYLKERDIETWGRTIQGFISGPGGLQTQIEVLKQTVSQDQTVYIKETLLPLLNDATKAGVDDNVTAAAAGLHETVHQMVLTIKAQTREQYFQQKGAPIDPTVDLALLGVTALLLALKMKIQLYATLAMLAQKAGDQENYNLLTGAWLDAYATYVININGIDNSNHAGYVSLMTTLISDAAAARISLVGAPYLVGSMNLLNKEGQRGFQAAGWGFTDAALEDPGMEKPPDDNPNPPQHYVPDTFESSPGDSCTTTRVSHQDQILAQQSAYIQTLKDQYAKRQSLVSAWADSVHEWSSHLPPQAPPAPPTIADNAAWAAATPQGPNWISGNKVAYALAFSNSNGPSQYGDFGPWTPISDKAYPSVTVPIDPLSMATARILYRKFSTTNQVNLVTVIPDNTSTTFIDKAD